MNITCYLIDDEYHALEILKEYTEQTYGLEILGFSTDPQVALHEVALVKKPDVIFLDIDMQDLSGLHFAEMVSMTTLVIFTTSYPEYAVEAFNKEAFDYLLKPITYERYLKSINKLRKNFSDRGSEKGKTDSIFIKTNEKGKIVRIDLLQILYIEALLNYVTIYLRSEKHIAYFTMNELEELLPKEDFSRVHKSFIVRNNAIISIQQNQIRVTKEQLIPLGRTYRENFIAQLQDILFRSKRNKNN